jgi:2-dehydro-3-deoxy-D-gluconate 5-dehydrogenase
MTGVDPVVEGNMFDLRGKVAIVTGGNGGIGLGMARGLASAGASLVLAARDAGKSRGAVAELEGRGASALALDVDVTDEASVAAMVAAVVERHGRVDILVNNAGINVAARPEALATADWHRVIDTNLTGAFLCARAVHPVMKRGGGGKVVNVGSVMSLMGGAFVPAYAASKGGIVQLTRSLACAWAADRIQANAILPGWIDTELTRRARERFPALQEAVLRRTPAGRWGEIDDLAGAAVFLSSSASDFITGATLCVDGGYTIQG